VFQDDRTVAGGRVETVDEVADGLRLDCTVWLEAGGRGRALEGTAVVVVPRDGDAPRWTPDAPAEPLSGTPLPGGGYRFDERRQAQVLDVLGGVAPADGSAHPLAAWVIAMGGAGVSIEELFAREGVAMEDGPMLGGHGFVLHRPLRIPEDYAVQGAIVSVEEKAGRRRGAFGVMTVRFEVADAAGEPAASCSMRMILPRVRPSPTDGRAA
jgi:hypothetical protein